MALELPVVFITQLNSSAGHEGDRPDAGFVKSNLQRDAPSCSKTNASLTWTSATFLFKSYPSGELVGASHLDAQTVGGSNDIAGCHLRTVEETNYELERVFGLFQPCMSDISAYVSNYINNHVDNTK